MADVMIAQLQRLAGTLLDTVYPPACMLCGIPLAEGPRRFMFCDNCQVDLCREPHAVCRRCSSTLGPGLEAGDGCIHCRETSFAFSSAFRLGPYDGKLREAILKMKHLPGESLAELIGSIWVEHHL